MKKYLVKATNKYELSISNIGYVNANDIYIVLVYQFICDYLYRYGSSLGCKKQDYLVDCLNLLSCKTCYIDRIKYLDYDLAETEEEAEYGSLDTSSTQYGGDGLFLTCANIEYGKVVSMKSMIPASLNFTDPCQSTNSNTESYSYNPAGSSINVPLIRKSTIDSLLELITNISTLGRYLSGWKCSTGTPVTNPTVNPYLYKAGDYFIVNDTATGGIYTHNIRMSGSCIIDDNPDRSGTYDTFFTIKNSVSIAYSSILLIISAISETDIQADGTVIETSTEDVYSVYSVTADNTLSEFALCNIEGGKIATTNSALKLVDNIYGSAGSTNYKPNGSSYTGSASAVVELSDVDINDMYYYDGSVWKLMKSYNKLVSFSNIYGNPEDNAKLANSLDLKQDVINNDNKLSASFIYNLDTVKTSGVLNTIIGASPTSNEFEFHVQQQYDRNYVFIENTADHSSTALTITLDSTENNYLDLYLCIYNSNANTCKITINTTGYSYYIGETDIDITTGKCIEISFVRTAIQSVLDVLYGLHISCSDEMSYHTT